jgi:hypothetical protein
VVAMRFAPTFFPEGALNPTSPEVHNIDLTIFDQEQYGKRNGLKDHSIRRPWTAFL